MIESGASLEISLGGRDVSRQAMIAGLRRFAGRVGREVVAEGIEEPADWPCSASSTSGPAMGLV